jgi:hypothetical protein
MIIAAIPMLPCDRELAHRTVDLLNYFVERQLVAIAKRW